MTATPRSRPQWRPLAFGALLIGEVLFLTLRFDTASFARPTHWWTALLNESSEFLRIAVSIAAACLLISVGERRVQVNPQPSTGRPHRWWAWLAVHGLVFLGFFTATAFLFEVVRPDDPAQWVTSLAWWLLGGLTLLTWALAVQPAGFWLALLRRGQRFLLTAAACGVLAYVVGNLTARLWQPLSTWTFAAVRLILGLVLRDCTFEPGQFVIGTPSFSVAIAPQCSGYEGIGLVAVFLVTYLWAFRGRFRFPRALLLVPLAVVLVWVLNVFRIGALVVLGDAGMSDLAVQGFHSQAGWLAFNAVALGFAAIAEHRIFLRPPVRDTALDPASGLGGPGAAQGAARPSLAAAYLAPFLVMIAAGMVARACGAGPFAVSGARLVAGASVLWYFRRSYNGLGWSRSWPAVGVGLLTAVGWVALVKLLRADQAVATGGELAPQWSAPWAVVGFLAQLVAYVVVTPVAEELAFRGYLARRLAAPEFEQVEPRRLPWLAVGLSALLFGILHGAYWLPATAAGVLFALAYRYRGRVGDAVIAHAMTNGLIAAYVLVTGEWFLWS